MGWGGARGEGGVRCGWRARVRARHRVGERVGRERSRAPRGDKMIGEIGFGLTRARRDVETRMRDGSSRGVDVVNCARGKGC